MSLSLVDLEKIQEYNPNLQYELHEGEIIVMSPSDFFSEEVGFNFGNYLKNWTNSRKLGRVTGSSAGFIMPNGDLLAPDVAFVKAEKLKKSPRSYAKIVPDLVVEIKSASDKVSKLENKLKRFLDFGVTVAILIDPDNYILKVFRLNSEPEILTDNDILTIPDLLPGWQVAIADLWPIVFED